MPRVLAPRTPLALVALVLALAPSQAARGEKPLDPSAKFHLGTHTRKVTTAAAEAQAAFDRGLTLAYAFSHHASEQAFRKAAAADPECAMAWWGVALVNGPHINLPIMLPDQVATSWEALKKAQTLATKASPVEQMLIG